MDAAEIDPASINDSLQCLSEDPDSSAAKELKAGQLSEETDLTAEINAFEPGEPSGLDHICSFKPEQFSSLFSEVKRKEKTWKN